MNKYFKTYFYLFMMQSSSSFSEFYSSQHAMTTSTVMMNGKTFTHTKKSDNGTVSEQFLINNVPVEQDEFNNELNSLKLAQMNHQEKQAQRKTEQQENIKYNLKTAMLVKLITESLRELQDNLAVLNESILKPYLIFDKNSINSTAELEQLNAWTAQLQKNLKSSLTDQNIISLQKLAEEIETKLELVHFCLKQSMQQATTQCDDTATLKKLLALIEA